jgi:predicted ribosomally synthesized peptide with nif11-like leader
MSVQDLKKYGKMAAEDPKIRAKAKEIGLMNVKGQAAYAKTLGLNFDEADMQALSREAIPKGELSEKDLQAVAGGVASATALAVAGLAVGVVGVGAGVTSTTTAGGW